MWEDYPRATLYGTSEGHMRAYAAQMSEGQPRPAHQRADGVAPCYLMAKSKCLQP